MRVLAAIKVAEGIQYDEPLFGAHRLGPSPLHYKLNVLSNPNAALTQIPLRALCAREAPSPPPVDVPLTSE